MFECAVRIQKGRMEVESQYLVIIFVDVSTRLANKPWLNGTTLYAHIFIGLKTTLMDRNSKVSQSI